MTIDYRIIVGKALTEHERSRIDGIIVKTFSQVNDIFNKWNPESEISRLNKLKAGIKVKLSPPLHRFFVTIGNIVDLTEGRFDPTVTTVHDLWKHNLELGLVPTTEEINTASGSVGWYKIHYDHGIFVKDEDSIAMDLSGIAKGLCVDMITDALCSIGYGDLFVEWGGEIRTSGKHPKGRPWALFIRGLDDVNSGHAIAYLHVKDRAIATSGDYLQNWTVSLPDGLVTYTHIIDPFLLRPLISSDDSVATASVMVHSCALADALATALMMFPSTGSATEWAEKLKLKVPNLTYWVMSRREWRENASKIEMEE